MREHRFLYVADLHGSETIYNKVINAAAFYKVNEIVVGGDLTGKMLFPIIQLANGDYIVNYFGEKRTVGSNKIEEVKKEIRRSGNYFAVMNNSEYEDYVADKNKIKDLFIETMLDSLKKFFYKAELKLREQRVKLYMIPGNDDYIEIGNFVNNYSSDVITPFEDKAVEFTNGFFLAGFGYSNPTPWNSPREMSEDMIYEKLKSVTSTLDANRTILVVHPPPMGCIIDKAPKLNDFKLVMKGSEVEMISVGSKSTRRIIEEFEPMLSLHGHIHESGGVDYLKGVSSERIIPCFNSGSEYSEGFLKGVLIGLKDKDLGSHVFVRG